MHGICMEYVWDRIFVEYAWTMYGIFVEYAWDMHGI